MLRSNSQYVGVGMKGSAVRLLIALFLLFGVNVPAFAIANGDVIVISKSQTSLCLHVRAATQNRDRGLVSAQTCRNRSLEQRWKVEIVWFSLVSDERYFRLRNTWTGRCLNHHSGNENRNGGRATVTSCTSHADQQWQLSPTPRPGQLNTKIKLRNRGTGRCLRLENTRASGNPEGEPVTLFDCSAQVAQNWRAILPANIIRMYYQNMALLVSPAKYGGWDREAAIKHIIAKLREWRPAVVGLGEVYADGERERISQAVADIYPIVNMSEGPDESDAKSDGGLFMLSRYPVVERSSTVFSWRNCAGVDCFAHKGVLRSRILFPSPMGETDVYLTHLQDPDAGRAALSETFRQARAVTNFVERNTGSERQAIVMGDLNINSLSGFQRGRLRQQIPGMMDLWNRCESRGPGITLDSQRDFAVGSVYRPLGNRNLRHRSSGGQRIDYFFQWPESRPSEVCRMRVVTEGISPDLTLWKRHCNRIPRLSNRARIMCNQRTQNIIDGGATFDLSDHYGLMYTRTLN